MSIQAVAWVLEHSEATLADRLVLIAIANHADARGLNAWPAVPLIAAEARVDRATVFRSIATLEELGELTVERHPGRANHYGITAIMGSQDATGRGSQDATGGVASTRQRGRRLRPEPLRTVIEPAQRVVAPDRCAQCGKLQFDCLCNAEINLEKSKERVRAMRRGERS